MAITKKQQKINVIQPVREIIGRVARATNYLWSTFATLTTTDKTVPDYPYWDKFRRGQTGGGKLAGLFAKPAAEIKADWIMGDGFQAKLAVEETGDSVDYTNGLLSRFTARVKGLMLSVVYDQKSLGDQYVVVNADGSLSVPSPETVKLEHDPLDYRQVTKATIRTKIDKGEVSDEYTLTERVLTVKSTDAAFLATLTADGWESASKDTVRRTFENLTGRLPVIHFPNDRSANETHGRPMYEGLLHLFERYDGALEKALDGAELMSNPIPVFEGLEDIQETIENNSEPTDETYTDQDGNTRSRVRITFDRFATILLGKGGKFQFASPARGFTDDIKSMLKLLFLLILEHVRIPEVVWGGELGQARASASEQMKTFYMHIAGQRLALEGMAGDAVLGVEAQGGLHELLDVWLRTRALVDRRVVVAPLRIKWPALGESDDELNLKWADSMHNRGTITDETFVQMSGRVEDPDAEVAAARKAGADKQDAFDSAVDDALKDEAVAA